MRKLRRKRERKKWKVKSNILVIFNITAMKIWRNQFLCEIPSHFHNLCFNGKILFMTSPFILILFELQLLLMTKAACWQIFAVYWCIFSYIFCGKWICNTCAFSCDSSKVFDLWSFFDVNSSDENNQNSWWQ